jgi:hypothetical protein
MVMLHCGIFKFITLETRAGEGFIKSVIPKLCHQVGPGTLQIYCPYHQ